MSNKLIIFLTTLCFFVSLSFIVVSVLQIQQGSVQVEQSMMEWDRQVRISSYDNLQVERLFDPEAKVDHVERLMEEESAPYEYIYSRRPEQGEVIGTVYIPKLDRELPIIHGSDSEELEKGVGHYIGSVLPGERDNTVLAGHRDTVFRRLGEVGVGDLIEIETYEGTFIYQVFEERIVDEDDRTVIVSYDEPILTLVTCYPFDFIGSAPERYILTGKLIEANGKKIEE